MLRDVSLEFCITATLTMLINKQYLLERVAIALAQLHYFFQKNLVYIQRISDFLMNRTLIIAEKPSVAADIARALGGMTRKVDYFEGEQYVISSAVGHLVEIAPPEGCEVKRGKWSLANLPVIPEKFDLVPITKTENRLNLLTRLINRKDIKKIINACDAGREGELIFRLIVQYADTQKPVFRLWLQSMTLASIREAFDNLRPNEEMISLGEAARCRSESDWLVGVNGTRAMTAFNSRDGGFYLTTVGRVQTPTLTVVVEKEEVIKAFKPKNFFEINATFSVEKGLYAGRWFNPKFKRNPSDPDARAERIWDKTQADSIVEKCKNQLGIVTEESKPTFQTPPHLFDLTSLQREANARFGFSAKTTLSIAQALYEKHKVLTYPRTDAKALPEDYIGTVISTISNLEKIPEYSLSAQEILTKERVKPDKKIFDNKKISDHFAIIPTPEVSKLEVFSETERKIYNLVTCRFLSVFFPPAEYLVTTRTTKVLDEFFKTEGRILVNPGWLSVYGKEEETQKNLVPITQKEQALVTEIEQETLSTKPPARYTEATLLSAMERAGKLVEDTELREALQEKGLGTPATRASIIEGLISENYLIREGKELHPTTKAFQLLRLLRGLEVTELTSAELTAEWEFKLSEIERGNLKRSAFMREIADMTRKIVDRAKAYQADNVPGDYATLKQSCPACNQTIQENYKRFSCISCDFSITKVPGGRQLEIFEAEELLEKKQIGPLSGFRSRQGRSFSAMLKLTHENKLEFDFGQEINTEEIDFSGKNNVGPCPKCKARVFEHGTHYLCEKTATHDKSCDFRSARIILQKEIPIEQMTKLLTEGKTDLLTGFVSSRTKRAFKAYLTQSPEGKILFEFEEKTPKTNKTQPKKQTSKEAKTTSKKSSQPQTVVKLKSPARKSKKQEDSLA